MARRIWRRASIHRVFFSLLGFNALLYMAGATFAPYISVYYRSQGISVSEIGILLAIGPLVTLVAQPSWGILGDKTGRHLSVLRLVIGGSMLAVLSFYLADSFWLYALAAGLMTLFTCGIQPMGDTVVVKEAARRGYRFSSIRMGGTLGYSLTVVLAGGLLKLYPSASFGLTSFLYLAMLLITFALPKPQGTQAQGTQAQGAEAPRQKLEIGRLFRNHRVILIILFAFVFQLGLSFYGAFIGVFVTEELGYDNSVIGVMQCIAALSEAPVLLFIDKALRRFRTQTLLVAAGFIMVVRLLLPPLTFSIAGVAVAQALQGMSFMIMYYSTVMYLNEKLDPSLRGTGMSVLCVVQGGMAALLSNVVGGQLGDRLGLRSSYLLYAGLLLVFMLACCGWLILRKRGKRLPEAA